MRRQKCAQCGTMLDISKLEGGSKFACASCGAILVVGEAAAVKRSLKEAGPAFTPKGKAETPAPAAPTSRRRAAEAERPSRRGEVPAKKSKTPLFLGIGGVVVVLVVVIILASGGGGGAGGGDEGPEPARLVGDQEPEAQHLLGRRAARDPRRGARQGLRPRCGLLVGQAGADRGGPAQEGPVGREGERAGGEQGPPAVRRLRQGLGGDRVDEADPGGA